MKFAVLKKHLRNDSLLAAYIITGDDSYVLERAVKMFEALITVLPEMNISVFSDSLDAQSILESLEVLPVLSEKRLVLVHGFKGDTTKFLEYLKNPNLTTILVFVEETLKENFAKIMSKLEPVDCNKLDTENISKLILQIVEKNNNQITNDALQMLIEYCGKDLSRITSELEKLCLYKLDDKITANDVATQVEPTTDYKIFELSEAVASKQNLKAAKVLKSLMDSKMPPVTLLGMLYSHFRRLLYISISDKSSNLASLLSVKEYAIKKSSEQAAKYSPLRLKKICELFHKADYDFKSGAITDALALETLIMSVLNEN